VLLVLGGAVAGWGCKLLSPAPEFDQAQYYRQLQEQQTQRAELLRQFDTLAAAQQGSPDPATLGTLGGYLAEYEHIPPGCGAKCGDLEQRQRMLANWGYASAQYWMGQRFDPSIHPEPAWYPSEAQPARDWYLKAAAQGHPAAQRALQHLDRAAVGRGLHVDVEQAFDAQTGAPDQAQQREMLARLMKADAFDCEDRAPCRHEILVPYFNRLAVWGNADAQVWLGHHFDPTGHSVPPADYQEDLVLARYWYGKAAAQGRADAAAVLASLPPSSSTEKAP
jgi:TPR repeat protein